MRFVVRRVVVLGLARNRLNIRFGPCTSCLFDNSSVKLCKARHAVLSHRKVRTMSRVWGRHAPTRSLRKCRRIAEVKSQWSTTFSRIENLWPRDGSCPLPLRSKRIFNKCFRIVKTQKTSRGCSAHVMGSPFAPNEVPAPVCAAALSGSLTESVRSWHSISFRRLM